MLWCSEVFFYYFNGQQVLIASEVCSQGSQSDQEFIL